MENYDAVPRLSKSQKTRAEEVNELAKKFKTTGDEAYLKKLIPLLESRIRKELGNKGKFKSEEDGGLTQAEQDEYIDYLLTIVLTRIMVKYDPTVSSFLNLFWTAVHNRMASDFFSKPSIYNIVGMMRKNKRGKMKEFGKLLRRPLFPPRSVEWILEKDESTQEGELTEAEESRFFIDKHQTPRDALEDREQVLRWIGGLAISYQKAVLNILSGMNTHQALREAGIRTRPDRRAFYQLMRKRLAR